MPLMRFSVRNEYGLGVKELYKDGVENEDPKAVLDGVAVAGLVGLLRQLGDLSQFAAEVFHGLQEQFTSTASRSRKLVARVQLVEASLPSLEKAMLSQTSHIHFCYKPGSEWHPRSTHMQNHFICDDLPHFIMDLYEECREPPRLQLLDRFDSGGPGSCLKRYSDPTIFRQSSKSSLASDWAKSLRERKTHKFKKRKSMQRIGQLGNNEPNMNNNWRAQVSTQTDQGLSTQSHTGSTFDMTFRSDQSDQPNFVGSKGQKLSQCDSHLCTSVCPNKTHNWDIISTVDRNMDVSLSSLSPTIDLTKQIVKSIIDDQCSPASEISVPRSSIVTWDEKLEIMDHMGLNCGSEDGNPGPNSCPHEQDGKSAMMENVNVVNEISEHGSTPKSDAALQYPEPTMYVKLTDQSLEDYLHGKDVDHIKPKGDQLGDMSDSGSSTISDANGHYCRTTDRVFVEPLEHLQRQEVKPVCEGNLNQVEYLSEPGRSPELDAIVEHPARDLDGGTMELTGLDCRSDDVKDLHETNFDLPGHGMSQPIPESFSQVTDMLEGEDILNLIAEGNFLSDPLDGKLSSGKSEYLIDTDGYALWDTEQIDAEHVGSSLSQVAISKVESSFEFTPDGNILSDPSDNKVANSDIQYMLEKNRDNAKLETPIVNTDYIGYVDTFHKDENTVNAMEWHYHDDIDSETDTFVDALNTIESESESDCEGQTRNFLLLTSNCELAESAAHDSMADEIIHPEVETDGYPSPLDYRDELYTDSEQPSTSISVRSSECLENAQLSQNQSEAAIGPQQNEPIKFPREQSAQSDSSSLANVSEGIRLCAHLKPRLQPGACDAAPSSMEASPDNKIACTPCVSQEMLFESTSSFSHAFWTNGTLFGLQPSKPPVLSVSNSVSSAPVSTNSGIVDECRPEADGPVGLPPSSAKVSHHYDNFDSDGQDIGSFTHTPPNVSEKTSNKVLDRDESILINHSLMRGLGNGHVPLHESKVGADFTETFSETTSTSEDRPSILSLLGRGLKNGLRRSGSLGYDGKCNASNPSTSDFDNLCRIVASDPLPESNLNGKLHSPVNSLPPSPPVEHMKVSFHPIEGFETSRLKLNYPQGIDLRERTVDMFPSFQLVPEFSRLQQGMASESDDDTFCRSYSCLSDDAASNLSDPDSEQWESGDTSGSNDHAYWEGLRRMSSIESGPISTEHDEKDQGSAAHSVSGPTPQLPLLRTMKQFAYKEMQVSLNPEGDSSHLQGLMPQPPPLPPLLWCVSKPMQNSSEDKPEPGANRNQSSDYKLSESAIYHPASLGSAKLESTMPESYTIAIQNKLDELKVSDRKQDYHVANGRTVDNREDFLHQIRSKSFNLKRTETTRALHTPCPVTSNQVTAILRKANAFHKAVGSDAEDDSWSDT